MLNDEVAQNKNATNSETETTALILTKFCARIRQSSESNMGLAKIRNSAH